MEPMPARPERSRRIVQAERPAQADRARRIDDALAAQPFDEEVDKQTRYDLGTELFCDDFRESLGRCQDVEEEEEWNQNREC